MAQAEEKKNDEPNPQQLKIIEQYKRVSESLEKQQSKSRDNKEKLEKLEKKISCLQFLRKSSEREAFRYQRKHEKLAETQEYATQLLKLKYNSFVKAEGQTTRRQQQCQTQRETLWRSRQVSQSIFDQRRNDRIRRIREEQERVSVDYQQKRSQMQASLREQKDSVRKQELRLKERKQRYEEFKMQQAALNYNEKLEQQLHRFRLRSQHLQHLKSKFQKEEQVFRKTQILSKQTAQIESIYLTGSQP